MILILLVSLVRAEYSFDLEIIKSMKKDQQYECFLKYDDSIKKINLRKNGKLVESYDKEFNNNISLSCNTNIDFIKLLIFHEGHRIDKKLFRSKSSINYNLNYNEARIKIKSDKNICNVIYDGINEEFHISNKEYIKISFKDKFNINCQNKTNELTIEVNSRQNKKLFYDSYENIQKISYDVNKSISKPYMTYIQIIDNFNKSNKCTFSFDNTKIEKNFNKNSKFRDLYFESKVGNTFKMICKNSISEINFLIKDRVWIHKKFEKNFNNTKSFNININNEFNNQNKTIQEEKINNVSKTIINNKKIENTASNRPTEVKKDDNKPSNYSKLNKKPEIPVIKSKINKNQIKVVENKSWFKMVIDFLFN